MNSPNVVVEIRKWCRCMSNIGDSPDNDENADSRSQSE